MYIDYLISPFEGSLRAGAAEYVHRGDVNNQRVIKSNFINKPFSRRNKNFSDNLLE